MLFTWLTEMQIFKYILTLNTVYIQIFYRAKNKIKYVENNHYLLGMHAVLMGTTTASTTPVVVRRRCRVMVFEKQEVVDKIG